LGERETPSQISIWTSPLFSRSTRTWANVWSRLGSLDNRRLVRGPQWEPGAALADIASNILSNPHGRRKSLDGSRGDALELQAGYRQSGTHCSIVIPNAIQNPLVEVENFIPVDDFVFDWLDDKARQLDPLTYLSLSDRRQARPIRESKR
jgi:hypothetical protein